MTELSYNQKVLMSLAGRFSVKDWSENLGDERLRMSRVMVCKLIRHGDEDVLDIVAEYLGTRLIRDSEIKVELDKHNSKFPDRSVTFEQIRSHMLRGRKIDYGS